MTFKAAALPPLTAPAGNGPGGQWTWDDESVHFSGGDLVVDASVFNVTNESAGTSLLTGVAIIDNLTLTVHNLEGVFTPSFSTTASASPGGGFSLTAGNPWGGNQTGSAKALGSEDICGPDAGSCWGAFGGTVDGQVLMWAVGGGLIIPFNIGPPTASRGGLGVGGNLPAVIPALATLYAQAGPWFTGKARVSGVTTNVIRIPGRGSVQGVAVLLNPTPDEDTVNVTTLGGTTGTATSAAVVLVQSVVDFTGTDSRTASGAGTIQLISPGKVDTGNLQQGVTPTVWRMTLFFVPEPGTVLLLVSGAAGLAFIGRKRMKR